MGTPYPGIPNGNPDPGAAQWDPKQRPGMNEHLPAPKNLGIRPYTQNFIPRRSVLSKTPSDSSKSRFISKLLLKKLFFPFFKNHFYGFPWLPPGTRTLKINFLTPKNP